MKTKALSLQGGGDGAGSSLPPRPSPRLLTFTVPGPLRGYRASWTRHDKKYRDFKTKVLLLAMEQGFPNTGLADRGHQPRLTVRVFWKGGRPRIDWANIYKAVEDALYYSDDCWSQPGNGSGFFCNWSEEFVEVSVEMP